jgi:hypothetical protein
MVDTGRLRREVLTCQSHARRGSLNLQAPYSGNADDSLGPSCHDYAKIRARKRVPGLIALCYL